MINQFFKNFNISLKMSIMQCRKNIRVETRHKKRMDIDSYLYKYTYVMCDENDSK